MKTYVHVTFQKPEEFHPPILLAAILARNGGVRIHTHKVVQPVLLSQRWCRRWEQGAYALQSTGDDPLLRGKYRGIADGCCFIPDAGFQLPTTS